MPNIRPVSDLRNYTDVLKDISIDSPVFLTKNGRGRYAIIDIDEYERTQAKIKIMSKLADAEQAAKKDGWIDADDVKKILGGWIMAKIKLSPLAISDLQEIKSYISDDLSNPIAANRVINQIIDDYTLLETSPEMGISLSAKINITTDYRYLVSGKYIVFYKTDTEYVYISRILYGARDYIRILFNDEITDNSEL